MENLSQYFDHTLLRPDANREQIEILCEEASTNNVAAVCIQPCWVKFCQQKLEDTGVAVCTVIGFPLGGDTTLTKAAALDGALNLGCDEFDIMANVGWFKSGEYKKVLDELQQLVTMANGKLAKIIIETGLMNDDEIRQLTQIVIDSGAPFIKTSTGVGVGGANAQGIKLIRESIGNSGLKIKASGGIKSADQVAEFLGLGVERFGSSHTIDILNDFANGSAG